MKRSLLVPLVLLLISFFAISSSIARDVTGTVTVSGTGTNLGGTVYVNLVNPSNVVVSSTTAAANGTYTLTGLPNAAGYKVVITNSPTNPSGNRLGDRYAVLVDVVGANAAAQTGDAALQGVIALPTGAGNVTGQSFQLGQQTAFDCANGVAYQVAQDAGDLTSTLFRYNMATGVRTAIGVTSYLLNSMIYSTADDMVWTTINGTNHIARVGAGAGVIEYAIPNLPVNGAYNLGAELPNGYMLITQSSINAYYVVDVDPTRATYLELVDPTAGYVLDTAPYGTTYSGAATTINCSDVAFHTATGAVVGVAAGQVVSLNPATGVISILGAVTGLPADGAYGSTFTDATGKLYLFNNPTGSFYQVNLATREATFLVASTVSGNNDGASCPTAIMCDISIAPHPQSDTVCLDPAGGNASVFTVTATGTGLTYQWQRSIDGGTTWANLVNVNNANGIITGVLSATLTVAPKVAAWNGYMYRAVVSSSGGLCSPTSNPATQTIVSNTNAVQLKALNDAPVCPATTYNLTNLPIAGNGPAGSTIVFYTSATPSAGTLVADPTAAPAPGTYFAFYKAGDCLSPASQQINIGACKQPFDCANGVAYQVAADGSDPSVLYSYNVNSGVRTPIAPLSIFVNSLAYNSVNNTMWATQNGSSNIARINPDGTTDLFAISNLPSSTYNVGFEMPNGYMVITSSAIGTYYVVDINPARATYLELVDPLNSFAPDTAPYGSTMVGLTSLNTSDQVFIPSRGFAYGVLNFSNQLIRFNPNTGGVANLGAIAGLPVGASGFGAVFTDANGDLFAFDNATGKFYYIDIDAKVANELSTSSPNGSNDGASCPTAVMCDITVVLQPLSDSTCVGSPVTFTSAATSTGTVNYQWQRSVDGGTTWANLAADFSNANGSITGVLTPAITVTPLVAAWNGHMYRVVLSTLGACQPVTTIATITVFANPPAPTLKTLSDAPVCPATTYNLTNLPFAGTTPTGATLVFYTSATPSAGTLVSDPTAAPAPGTYYAFYRTGNCLSPASQPINIGGCIPPFTCTDGIAYQVAAPASGTSSLYTYDVKTGTRTLVAATPYSLNALIYGSADNTLWSVKNDGAGNLVRIDGNGATTQHTVANLPAANYNIGAELPNSYMLITSSGINTYYVIDVNPARSTYLELVDPTNGFAPDASPFGTTITGAANVGTSDLAFNSADNLLYGILNGGNSLQSINPATGAVTNLGAVAGLPGTASDNYGAVFGDPTGNLYVFNNATGAFYQVTIAGRTASLLSNSIPSGNNDGASCPSAVLPVTLATFSVAKEGATAQLQWTTTEEVNAQQFEIQRSGDAKTWIAIARKMAVGESKTVVKYDFTDANPLGGSNYYRLKMIDKDGTFAYSRIQNVDFGASRIATAFPNPATERLRFKNFEQIRQVTLHTMAGLKVAESQAVTVDGLDISKLTPGMYAVTVTLADGSKDVQKVVILMRSTK
ncbi:DUF6923 family protein [Dyadobacter sp. MSC1_007]|jgi:hypothetical protein|uniref:DUF6923 family protein n=1 Tax=Dyadobacter sp. MSC1_007 TaxID=2909264 RepID=UPI00202DDD66|nr:T9SS type A sorting domain-containing protein [Dyadobacter sp. MSC1_007]